MRTLIIGIVCLVLGILVLIFPKILNYIVGIGLIIIGALYLIPYLS